MDVCQNIQQTKSSEAAIVRFCGSFITFTNMASIKKLKAGCILLFLFSVTALEAQKDTLYRQTGMASFYAHKFHGRKTASGETFHKDSLTAAHKFLPFGTRLKVTNPNNNYSVIVRVNDRGMKGTNRIIDLSPAAAKQIDMIKHGTLKVRVEEIR